MTTQRRIRSSGPQHTAATRRLSLARARQRRLRATLDGARPTVDGQSRLSAGRASIASCAAWLHWVDRAKSLEPWADGEWAPRPAVSTGSWMALAQPECVGDLRGRVADFARAHGVDPALAADVELVASEAITNAVIHAYRDRDAPGPVTLTVGLDRDADLLRLVVVDSGTGMAPDPDSTGAGLGLGIMRAVTEQVEVRAGPDGTGTEVSLTFALR